MTRKEQMKQYASDVVANLNERGNYHFSIDNVEKNGISKTAIRLEMENISPQVYLEHFNDIEGRFDEVCDAIYDILIKSLDNVLPLNGEKISNYDAVKDNLIIAVAKKGNVRKSTFIFKSDIAEDVVFYLRIYDTVKDISCAVTQHLITKWCLDNTITTGDIIKRCFERIPENMTLEGFGYFHVLSYKHHQYGAGIMADMKTLESVCDILGANEIFIIPSSIHEVLVIDKACDIPENELLNMVKSINADESLISREIKLTDNVYSYKRVLV